MSDVVNPILQWLNAHPNLAGIGTFIISAAESVAIIGTIVPGSVMMTAIGALAGAGVIPLYSTIVWAILGAIVGDGISYWIGHSFKDRLRGVWPFKTRPSLLEKAEIFFHKYGSMSVFIGRFVGPVRALVPVVAGMLGMKPLRFYIANILSAIFWAPAYMLPGIILGVASLELPPDIAVHAMLVALLVVLFVILCVWSTYKIIFFLGYQFNQGLNRLWGFFQHSRHFSIVATALKHHDHKKTHGQLILAAYFVLTFAAFLYLAAYVFVVGSHQIFLNHSSFHLFRSLRTPLGDTIMIALTFFGEKIVLGPLIVTLFIYFAIKKRMHTAWHVLAFGILVGISLEFFKYLVHSPRPWGIVQSPHGFSFPSGHATLSLAYYVGILLLINQAVRFRFPRLIYSSAGIFIFLIGVSRLYLNAHWLTDVIGGWLLGTAMLMLIILSYNRKQEKPLNASGIIAVVLATLAVAYSVCFIVKFPTVSERYTQLSWTRHDIKQNEWWTHNGDHLPLHRINRFGLSGQILNLQWIGELEDIKKILLANGWQVAPKRDWISVLHRVIDLESSEHLPIVSPLYLDKNPVLVLVKHGNKKITVLRLWDSNRNLIDSKYPLWVGLVDVAPRTYSWLFNRKQYPFVLTEDMLFKKIPSNYRVKVLKIKTIHKKRAIEIPIILIKPK